MDSGEINLSESYNNLKVRIMEIRIDKKTIEIKGRKFTLNKFDPFFGSYMAFKVLNLGQVDESSSDRIISVFNTLMGKDLNEFETIQKKVLSYCSENLPAGEVPLINSEGNIAIINLTAPMAMSLFIQTIMFSMSDFFEEGAIQMDLPINTEAPQN